MAQEGLLGSVPVGIEGLLARHLCQLGRLGKEHLGRGVHLPFGGGSGVSAAASVDVGGRTGSREGKRATL